MLFVLAGLFLLLAITVAITSKKQSGIQVEPTIFESPININRSMTPSTQPPKALDLTSWKLTLPTGSSGDPIEIMQPKLDGFELNPWFIALPEARAIRFRAAVNGVTTGGSDYPRTELREMTDSETKASWSSENGKHSLYIEQAITAVPSTKRDVVAGQIHDDERDVIVIRLDYPVLHVRINGTNVQTLDPNYTLGKRFNIRFEVNDNQTKVYYNNSTEPVYTLSKNYSGAYFKAGVYTQSNCDKEKVQSLCTNNNYGEVVIYRIEVSHQ
ncbi:MAG: Alginate lyase 2 [Candidatus Shapirobacteria bacterium GW2011_GWE1_38_10]|uniref:Alginate lyase 2 n=1 Tax=Candidatus Shapirobacteria bacterium GW2011_GWE1_38_10 TaxID=1618488 RepID=A0A0G0I0E5_9BACT|nr:MAG: Alginate lyase 2 [Candidatus Shapirobacteria bacterium GW2011_GWE1_38_10]